MRTPRVGGTLRRGLSWLALAVLLQGCGGGSSGEDSSAIGAHMTTSSVRVERDIEEREWFLQGIGFALLVEKPPAGGYWYRATSSSIAISSLSDSHRSDGGIDFLPFLLSPEVLGVGIYNDHVTIEVCLDSECNQHARGSPFVVAVTVVIGYFAPTEPGLAPLAVASRTTLPHDLVDAAYSPALDAVITVSRLPAPALNLFYLDSGQTRSVALAMVPTAVGLAPDGLRAAVGHDGAVSVVTLQPLASAPAMTAQRFAVSAPIHEVVIDGQGQIFAFGNGHIHWNTLHVLDPVGGTETVVDLWWTSDVAHAAWHPSGERFYIANENVSPTDIFSVDPGSPSSIVDSPYHADYEPCGDVWVSDDGARLFTACGNTFVSSASADQDMRFAGALPLSEAPGPYDAYTAVALSARSSADQVVLLEQPRDTCDPRVDELIDCFTHLNLYTASTLALQSSFSLAPISVGNDRFAQDGRFVFHRANGRIVLLSELRNAPDPTAGVLLSQLP